MLTFFLDLDCLTYVPCCFSFNDTKVSKIFELCNRLRHFLKKKTASASQQLQLKEIKLKA